MADIQSYYKKSLALVIGINSYTDPRFVPLGEAENDARKVADLLKAPPYQFEVGVLLGEQATRQRILDALYALRKAEPDDRVLVYFAGHGYTEIDNFGQETGYLASVDTLYDRNSSALKLTDLTDLRRYSNAMHIGFIFDACFSGQALGITRGTAEVLGDRRRAFQVISAGAGDQTVSDYNSMTDVMVEALRGGSPDMDEMLTFNSLGLYLQQRIAAQSGRMQIPQFGSLTGHQGDDMVLYYDTSPHLPRELEQALDSSSANVRRGAVAELVEIVHGEDEELALLADQRLTEMLSDPDERVRNEVMRFIDPGVTQQSVNLGQQTTSPTRDTSPSSFLRSIPMPWLIGGVAGIAVLAGLLVVLVISLLKPGPASGEPDATPDEPSETEPEVTAPPAELPTPTLSPEEEALRADTTGTLQEDVVPADLHLLNVPFYSQNNAEWAAFSENDEGPACLAMLMAGQGKGVFTVDQVYDRSEVTTLDQLTDLELVTMGAALDTILTPTSNATIDNIKQWVDQDLAVIVSFNYQRQVDAGLLPENSDVEHMVLVVGYDDKYIYIHDPAGTDEQATGVMSATDESVSDITPAPTDNVNTQSGEYVQIELALFAGLWTRTALVPEEPVSGQIEFTTPNTTEILAGFDPPIGTLEERQSDQVWPGRWIDATGFATFFNIGAAASYHTGADLNLNFPSYDGDRDSPVYATGSGLVIYAGELSSTWGNVIIIRHDPLANGEVYWSRYSQLGDLLVEKGEHVDTGQQISTVGNTGGTTAYHLHFDIAKTNILEISPGHWPGANLEAVLANYVDPAEFIADHRPPSVISSSDYCDGYTPSTSSGIHGVGALIRSFSNIESGDPQQIVARMQSGGVSFVVMPVEGPLTGTDLEIATRTIDALHEAGFAVWGDQWFVDTDQQERATDAMQAVCQLQLDGLIGYASLGGSTPIDEADRLFFAQAQSLASSIPLALSVRPEALQESGTEALLVFDLIDYVIPIYAPSDYPNPALTIRTSVYDDESLEFVPYVVFDTNSTDAVNGLIVSEVVQAAADVGYPAVLFDGWDDVGDTFWNSLDTDPLNGN